MENNKENNGEINKENELKKLRCLMGDFEQMSLSIEQITDILFISFINYKIRELLERAFYYYESFYNKESTAVDTLIQIKCIFSEIRKYYDELSRLTKFALIREYSYQMEKDANEIIDVVDIIINNIEDYI